MKPEEVFTPRSAEVNSAMYVSRQKQEEALSNALRGNQHIIIHGESGTGKSWLYKHFFSTNKVCFSVANLANASRFGSISAALTDLIDGDGRATKVGYEEEKTAGVNTYVINGELKHTGQYAIGQKEPFEDCLASLRERAGSNNAVLVFDNLEAVFSSPELLKELADLITLCDDERYAKYKTKILIVGIPAGIREYFYKTPQHSAVANRLYELPEVSRLSKQECDQLVNLGFLTQLAYKIDDGEAVLSHIRWITDRMPQAVHEFCLELAFLGEKSRSISDSMLKNADEAWMSKSLSHVYAIAEGHMNERDTRAGRRNQTLFALSKCESEQFKASSIEEIIRSEFPTSTNNTTLNVPQTLSQLASGDKPIIRRSAKGDSFTFIDPRSRMVLRSMLKKNADEQVEKIAISRNLNG